MVQFAHSGWRMAALAAGVAATLVAVPMAPADAGKGHGSQPQVIATGLDNPRQITASGGDFYVATPARDMFIAMTAGPTPFIERLRGRVRQDYRRLPYPITSDLFYVTRDGVAGTRPEAA